MPKHVLSKETFPYLRSRYHLVTTNLTLTSSLRISWSPLISLIKVKTLYNCRCLKVYTKILLPGFTLSFDMSI